MRRDMDLVRRILRTVADAPGAVDIGALTTAGDDREKVGEHIRLMTEAGLVQSSIRAAGNDPYYWASVSRLTWKGQDYLAAVGADDVWDAVKREGVRAGLELTLDTAKALASKAIARKLGLED